jgi:hypothetical protein
MSAFPGPVPPETNPPIEPQNYQPSVFPITAIMQGTSTTVTVMPVFGVNANYVIGQLVRFWIPSFYGMRELNGMEGYVVALPSLNQVTVQINSTNFTPFNPTPSYGPTPPQIAAIGDVNTGIISSTGRSIPTTNIPGSFINISPVEAG